jgi:hypothetical protein
MENARWKPPLARRRDHALFLVSSSARLTGMPMPLGVLLLGDLMEEVGQTIQANCRGHQNATFPVPHKAGAKRCFGQVSGQVLTMPVKSQLRVSVPSKGISTTAESWRLETRR